MYRTFEPYATLSQWKLFTGAQDLVPVTIAEQQNFKLRILSQQPIADIPMWFAPFQQGHSQQKHGQQECHKLPAYQKSK